jgi:hypothetical protein
LVAATVPLYPWRSRPERWSEGIRVADLRTQSPPLAIALERIVRANDPKATATCGNREPFASFEFFRLGTTQPLVGQSPSYQTQAFPALSDFAPSSETPGGFVGQAGVPGVPGVIGVATGHHPLGCGLRKCKTFYEQ